MGSFKHSNIHSGFIKHREFLTSWATISFSRRTLLHGVSYRMSCHWHLLWWWRTLVLHSYYTHSRIEYADQCI